MSEEKIDTTNIDRYVAEAIRTNNSMVSELIADYLKRSGQTYNSICLVEDLELKIDLLKRLLQESNEELRSARQFYSQMNRVKDYYILSRIIAANQKVPNES